ncbi:MAG: hypothetical protein ACOVP8_02150, partial [Phycisphaerales bacterium]
MSSLHVRTRLMLLAAALVPAASALAQTVSVSTQGVLVTDVAGLCTSFLGDDGNIYFPSSTGAFTAGDRFHLAGTYNLNQIGTCLDTAGFVLGLVKAASAEESAEALASVIASPLTQRLLDTLTEGSLEVLAEHAVREIDPHWIRRAIGAIEAASSHPIAVALRRWAREDGRGVTSRIERAGEGLAGSFQGRVVVVGNA